MMNPKIKAEWLALLRSGDIPQTTGRLNRVGFVTPGMCCLGVLCEVAARHDLGKWQPIPEFDCSDIEFTPHINPYTSSYNFLPHPIAEAFGLDGGGSPQVRYKGEVIGITSLNDGCELTDGRPLTFAEIADIIEEQL